MENTGTRRTAHNTRSSDAAHIFRGGMHAYALSQPAQLRCLFRLSSAAALGMLIGIFLFFFSDAVSLTDAVRAADDYIRTRAFSSYSTPRDYLTFFSAWFFHHAWPIPAFLGTLLSVCPLPLCYLITLARGLYCGFALCTLTGRFSLFAVFMALAQGGLCAICVYLGTKCTRFSAKNRHRPPAWSAPWLLGEAAPLTVSLLAALSAQATAQLLISTVCTLLCR